jgi:hypothetical protein
MKNSSYKSVPVIASIIGSKSRKAMYLTNVTSLDGKRIYKDKWIPTSWSTNSKYEFRYTNKERGLHNQLIVPGSYYKFNFKDSVLMTDQGAVNEHGAILEVKGLTKVKKSASKQTIEWEYDSQSLVEFPMNKVSEAMVIDKYDDRNVSAIKSKLVDGKVQDYLQLKDRYVIYVPTWLIKNFEERYTTRIVEEELFDNDDMFYGIAEDTAIQSVTAREFSYVDRLEMNFETINSLSQWEIDNPEYASYS